MAKKKRKIANMLKNGDLAAIMNLLNNFNENGSNKKEAIQDVEFIDDDNLIIEESSPKYICDEFTGVFYTNDKNEIEKYQRNFFNEKDDTGDYIYKIIGITRDKEIYVMDEHGHPYLYNWRIGSSVPFPDTAVTRLANEENKMYSKMYPTGEALHKEILKCLKTIIEKNKFYGNSAV